jgi:hypothetical protein
MTVPSRLLQQCFQEALSSAPDMLTRCADAAIASLPAAEKASREVAQRDRLALAWWGLLQNKIQWGRSFSDHLRDALLAAPEVNSSRPALLSESSLLSLVEDDAVNESLESARLVHSLMPVLEQQLTVLDALISSVIGLQTVQSERNPMRPSVFVRALRSLMASAESEPEVRALWLRHMGDALGRELQKLYERVALILQRANVQEAGYRVRLVDDAGSSTRSGGLSTRSGGLGLSSRAAGLGVSPNSQWQDMSHHVASGQDTPAWASADQLPPMQALGRMQPGVDHQVFHDFLN